MNPLIESHPFEWVVERESDRLTIGCSFTHLSHRINTGWEVKYNYGLN